MIFSTKIIIGDKLEGGAFLWRAKWGTKCMEEHSLHERNTGLGGLGVYKAS